MTAEFHPYRAARAAVLGLACLAIGACSSMVPEPREPGPGHVGSPLPVEQAAASSAIPRPVTRAPLLPVPAPAAPAETYTVVVNGVPVRELLFALARDAAINVDIHPDIEGSVTLNAIEQSLPQILERLTRQVSLRYRFDGDLLVIAPDTPFLRTYTIDYVNVSRTTSNQVSVATQIAATSSDAVGGSGASGGDNNSLTTVESSAEHRIWETLTTTVAAMIDEGEGADEDVDDDATGSLATSRTVIANPETGLLTVRATAAQHDQIRAFLDRVMTNLLRQVLIEATVVEVRLNDRYRAGIDWSSLAAKAGVSLTQSLGAGTLIPNIPSFILNYTDATAASSNSTTDLTVTARLLKEFGDIRVISSPKVMALNNQTALLKVVDNTVYFTVDSDTTIDAQGNLNTTVETTPQTVPVGFVMAVTPQINASDSVTLNVRPTITRILRFVNDPNPTLNCSLSNSAACVPVENPVPEIQVREFESMLRTQSGQIAVLGGLMEDNNAKGTDGVPFLSDIPDFGEFFKVRDNNFVKSELVVFIRPWVVRKPSVLDGDLQAYKQNLPENLETVLPINSPPPGFLE